MIDDSNGRFYIWDLGDVLVDVAADFPYEYFTKDNDFVDFEAGRLSSDDFFKKKPELKKKFNNYLSINTQMAALARKTPNSYFLSNTNPYHFEYLMEELDTLDRKRCFLSFELNMRKPDPAIYKFVQETLHSAPKDIYFIDDQIKNIEAARKLGWNCFHYQNNIGELKKWINI